MAIFCAFAVPVAFAAPTIASIDEAKPLSLNDAADWPVALDVAPDGRVWVAMATDVRNLGGVARYTADLDFEAAWEVEGRTTDVATAPDGSVYLPSQMQPRDGESLPNLLRLSSEGVRLGMSQAGFVYTEALAAHEGGVWGLGRVATGVTTTMQAFDLNPLFGNLSSGTSFEADTGHDPLQLRNQARHYRCFGGAQRRDLPGGHDPRSAGNPLLPAALQQGWPVAEHQLRTRAGDGPAGAAGGYANGDG